MLEHARDYDYWAWLYNQTLGPRYAAFKIGPIQQVVLPHIPAGGRILDLCCGTGHLVALLTARGYAVTGLDGSADMLRHAKANAPTATFVEGDARSFAFEAPFDAVLCSSASLNHMASLADLRGVFGCVNRSLKMGGVFAFDVNHPAQMARGWHGQPAEGEILPDYAWLITPHYDPSSRRGDFTVDIYRRPDQPKGVSLKDLVGRIVQSDAMRSWRLKLLARYGTFRPDWDHRSVVNVVWGHDLEAVTAALREIGFAPQVNSTSGGPADDTSSVYFLCRKTAEDLWRKTAEVGAGAADATARAADAVARAAHSLLEVSR